MIGKRLRKLREQWDYTQDDLAQMLKVSKHQLWRWETGKNVPTSSVLRKIAEIFNTSTDYLVGLTEFSEPYLDDSSLTKRERQLIAMLRHRDLEKALVQLVNIVIEQKLEYWKQLNPNEKGIIEQLLEREDLYRMPLPPDFEPGDKQEKDE